MTDRARSSVHDIALPKREQVVRQSLQTSQLGWAAPNARSLALDVLARLSDGASAAPLAETIAGISIAEATRRRVVNDAILRGEAGAVRREDGVVDPAGTASSL